MRFPFSRPTREWTPTPPEFGEPSSTGKKFLAQRLIGVVFIFLFGFLIYTTNSAAWMKRLTLCMLFCGLIYVRDDSPRGRWVAIGIIAAGTLLSILLPLLGIDASFFRRAF